VLRTTLGEIVLGGCGDSTAEKPPQYAELVSRVADHQASRPVGELCGTLWP
jgi:hypothetical protein